MDEQPFRILLIDDDADSLLITKGLLAQASDVRCEVEWMGNYESGLEALRRGGYRACLLDYQLGERDGLELLHQAVAEGCRVPVIMLTGRGEHAIDLRAMNAGAADYLDKATLDPSRLERSIRYAAERQRLSDALEGQARELRSNAAELELFRKRQVEELSHAIHDRLAELEALFEIAPVGIWVAHDPECRRITGNKYGENLMEVPRGANISQSSPEGERLGFKISRGGRELTPDELPLQYAAKHGVAVLNYELDFRMPDGRILNAMGNAVPLFGKDGRVRGAMATSWDITSVKQAAEEARKWEAKLQQTQKLESLGVLAGGIAHDFNNLLTGILGYADLALLELPPAAPVRYLVEQTVEGARRAAELTGQMLAYSGKGRFVVQPVLLADAVRDISHLLQVSISKKCVLKYHFEPDAPAIETDATQLRQIIMNLIINASEAIGDRDGIITVTTGTMVCARSDLADCYLDENLPEGRYAFAEVADTGCGMTQETLARIFDPFFTTKTTGRGLGLAAVLGIVRGHRGVIKVASQPGRGTSFRVLFPVCERAPVSVPTNPSTGAPARAVGTILVIDDEHWVRDLARSMLRSMGFEVLLAANGREGVDIFKAQGDRIAAVLLDLTMPQMGGEETFRELRRVRADVRVILSSGYNEESATSQIDGAGLVGFLQKPYRYEALAEVMRRATQ